VITPELVMTIVIGIGLGLRELRSRRQESKVVAAAQTVDKKTDDQTELLKEIKHDLRNVRNVQGGMMEPLLGLQRDVSDIKGVQKELHEEVGGLKASVGELKDGQRRHGERLGALEAKKEG
jgi:hypothetical protein